MVLGSTSMRCGGGTPAYLSGEKASRLVLDPWNGTDSFDRRFLPTVRMATSSSIQLSMITPCLSSVGSSDGRNECQARTGKGRFVGVRFPIPKASWSEGVGPGGFRAHL